MFQATELMTGHQRPAIMHAYGGAKVEMDRALATIATEGWIPMAAAMLGTANRLPMCENHVRELRTFFTVVLEPNIHTFSVLSETLQDFLKSKLC